MSSTHPLSPQSTHTLSVCVCVSVFGSNWHIQQAVKGCNPPAVGHAWMHRCNRRGSPLHHRQQCLRNTDRNTTQGKTPTIIHRLILLNQDVTKSRPLCLDWTIFTSVRCRVKLYYCTPLQKHSNGVFTLLTGCFCHKDSQIHDDSFIWQQPCVQRTSFM